MLLLPLVGIAGAGWWWMLPGAAVLPGIAWSNGRLEADEIDVAIKFAGHVAEITVDEGDLAHAGQVVARVDTRDFEAQLAQAKAGMKQADHNVTAAHAALDQQRTVLILAVQELQRSLSLLPKGFETRQVVDQRQQAVNGVTAGFQTAQAILFRGAGFATAWPDFLVSAGVRPLFAPWRFRQASAVAMQ